MRSQPDLFDRRYPAAPGHRNVSTQIAAAQKIEPHMPKMQRKVYEHIASSGGATRQEVSDALGIRIQTVCGRVGELKATGRVRDTETVRNGGKVVVVS